MSGPEHQVYIGINLSTFTVNGIFYPLDVRAQIINGSTMLPIRAIIEAVGYWMGWDSATQTVQIFRIEPEFQPPPLERHSTPQFPTPTTAQLPHIATQSSIILPSDRKLTESELQEWIDEYWAMGGMSEPERELIELANYARVRFADLPELEIDENLSMAARHHVQIVANADFYEHLVWGQSIALVHTFGPNGGSLATGRELFNVRPTGGAGPTYMYEVTPQIQIDTLMSSDAHRGQLMRTRNTRIGVGAQIGESGRIYYYMLYSNE
jgi:uncharacterized protein YkwD